jgi:hypothetical protein
VDQQAETHHGGVFSLIQSLPTPVPGVLTRLSQSIICPSIAAIIKISGENVAVLEAFSKGGAFFGGATEL